ncbi:MAG TPA: 3-phosphoserine/phosphohydroxythreonine transaminase [Fimbriimonadales bacterium]|nr:3-phosphoserine/phosphohydroxythreonine transaminase [Fimbriimonadales bacterium]
MIPTEATKSTPLAHGRVYNFSAGPGGLPVEVLEEAQQDLVNYKGAGMSVLEMSHRGKVYDGIHMEALANLRKLMNVPDDWGVLFLQGGASMENALIPLNLKIEGRTPSYITTGHWGNLSAKHASKLTPINTAWTDEENGFTRAPADDEPQFTGSENYVYYTSNETVDGIDFRRDPKFATDALIVCDASSNILSRPFDLSRYDVVFAGAQKNQGPAGVATVILSPRALEVAAKQDLPLMFSWSAAHKAHSIHNTPPTFAIYICGLYYKWLLGLGGVSAIEPINKRKAKLIYDAIDNSGGFYSSKVDKGSRSLMNILFTLPSDELTAKFMEDAKQENMVTLKGHRSTGGIRASMYNAFPESGAVALSQFMADFAKRNG